jgi:hypothetical protein
MPSYKNAHAQLTTVAQTVYTAPAGGALVTLIQLANITTVNADVTVQWLDASAGNAVTRLLRNGVVGKGDALEAKGGGFVLEEGDAIQLYASADNAIEASLSVVEGA